MLTNAEMISNRYRRWMQARRLTHAIQSCLSAGGLVQIATMTKCWQYDHRHVAMFKACRNGTFVQHGKRWDCIDYAGIRFYDPIQKDNARKA